MYSKTYIFASNMGSNMRNDDDVMLEIYKLLEVSGSRNLHTVICQQKELMGISDYQMSKILDIDKSTFNRLIKKIADGQVNNVDFYSILKICQFLGIGIEEMSQIYVASLQANHIAELEQARKANYIINHFDIKGLKDAGFIDTTNDFKAIENRLVKFFCLDSIFTYSSQIGGVAFSRTKRISDDKMREFWVRSAFFQFEKIANPNQYKKEELLSIIPKIGPYTRYEEKGFLTVIQALYNIGITVIVQSYLSKTQVRGGTFIVNDKPCIVVTDFQKTYYSLWVALMHELYHILFDLEQLKSLRYHLTGEAQSDLYLFREDYADLFSWEMLFQQAKLDFIKQMISSPAYVDNYAKENKVHPSIIYGFYCYEEKAKNKREYYGLYQQYFAKADKALKTVRINPWNKATIYEGIEETKQLYTITNETNSNV
jgi:Zn-dependent peptidase ImmA (M78 family)/DNA-binding Xre family transcriptional regulator